MRTAGILLPITSLPNKYGIGCFSLQAKEFIDFLKLAGQHYWQILPIGPAGLGYSPYQSYCTFAIDPMFIDIQSLIDEGTLTDGECRALEGFSDNYADYENIIPIKLSLLKKSYKRRGDHKKLEEFAEREAYWLDSFALFMDIHDRLNGLTYTKWSEEFRLPDWSVVDRYKEEHDDDINFYRYVQFKAYEQWMKIKEYANKNNVEIIGDLPIYVSPDGSDVWLDKPLFQMDCKGNMDYIAGCPGDDYAPKGQLWGNPLYNWDYHRETGYAWWISRMEKALKLYDVVRIDHFRGFDEYFSIPVKDENADNGRWIQGPGMDLFNALKKRFGDGLRVIAEDLGFLTDGVRKLRTESGFPGMKVLQFAYNGYSGNEYLPHLHVPNSVCYTGTHDNQTTLGWLTDKNINKDVIKHILEYHGIDKKISKEALVKRIIAIAYASVANTCIIPMQDYLCLDNSARINIPSTVGGRNWRWRMKTVPEKKLAENILHLVKLYGRG